MKPERSILRAAAVLAAGMFIGACGDSPVGSRAPGVQIMISLGSQVTASRTVDIVVAYETSGGGQVTLLTSPNLPVATGTQQLPIAVDLTRCLSDANHVGGAGACRLHVRVTLKNPTTGVVLDEQTLGPIAASPGSSPAAQTVTVAAADVITLSGLLPQYSVGQTAQVTASVRDAAGNALNRPVTWASTATAVATVSSTGLVTAVGPGTAQIRATAGGVSALVAITVIAPVATVSVAPGSASLLMGQTVQLTATLRDAAGNPLTGRSITWTSSTNAVTVSSSGLVTAIAVGGAVVTATSEGRIGTASITVNPPVVSVTLSPVSVSLVVGQTTQFTATPRDAAGNALAGRAVTWSISGTAATVSQTGVVTAVAVGTAVLTATSEGTSGTASITVGGPVATVTLTPTSAALVVGQTVQFTATLRDAGGNLLTGRTVTWSIGGSAATVAQTGVVTATAAGTSVLTATSEGRTATANITVTDAQHLAVTPSSVSGMHKIAVTSCPQLLGSIVLENSHTASVAWTAASQHSALQLDGPTSGTLAPGATASFNVRFTCATAQSFNSVIMIGSQSGGLSQSKVVPVSMTVTP